MANIVALSIIFFLVGHIGEENVVPEDGYNCRWEFNLPLDAS